MHSTNMLHNSLHIRIVSITLTNLIKVKSFSIPVGFFPIYGKLIWSREALKKFRQTRTKNFKSISRLLESMVIFFMVI